MIDFKSRVFDIISVRIKPSDKIRKIRDKIEGKKYKYSRSELVESYYKDAAWYHKFRHVFGDVGWIYFEDLEDSLPMKRIIALFDSNQDFVLTKTIIGENLYWNYIYNPKTIKYKEIIEKIKIDFAGYNSNNEFYYLNQTKGTYGSEYKFDKKRIKLSKVRKKYFLNVDSYEFGNFDIDWLQAKIGLKIDQSKLMDSNYINNLKETYRKETLNKNECEYIDLSRVSEESAYRESGPYGNDWYDEIISISSEEKKRLLKVKKDYYDNLYEKYGAGVEEEFKELLDSESADSDKIKRVIKKGNEIIHEEYITSEEVPAWEDIELVESWNE